VAAKIAPEQKSVIAEDLPDKRSVQPVEEQRGTEGTITFGPAAKLGKSTKAKVSYDPVLPENAEDTLQLDLPDRLEMIQLLDLVAEYLRLDYMYEPEKIKGQVISLRLHGKLQGEVRVKDLYPLLESVLKFKGFAMTCHPLQSPFLCLSSHGGTSRFFFFFGSRSMLIIRCPA
jgi:hypothetical protein